MRVTNCVRCKQVFTMINKPICPDCIKKEEEQFEVVREFLNENRGSTIEEIVEATGVPIKRIQQFIKEGRLEGIDGQVLTCSKCGIPILKGKYCRKCTNKLLGSLNENMPTQDIDNDIKEKSKIHLMKAKHIGH